MQSLLEKLECYNPSKLSLKASCRENDLKISYLNHFSIRKARKILKKLENMYKICLFRYEHNLKPNRCNWFENELKVYQFTLLFLSNIHGKKIMEFVKFALLRIIKTGLTFRWCFRARILQNCNTRP